MLAFIIIYSYSYIHLVMYSYAYVVIHLYIHMFTHIYIYIYVCIYTCIYVYTRVVFYCLCMCLCVRGSFELSLSSFSVSALAAFPQCAYLPHVCPSLLIGIVLHPCPFFWPLSFWFLLELLHCSFCSILLIFYCGLFHQKMPAHPLPTDM